MLFKIPIKVQKMDPETETWSDYMPKIHANINKQGSDSEYLNAGAEQSKSRKVFTVRYNPMLKEIDGNTQLYRIVYAGRTYDIADYDDFEERHLSVKLLGVG